MLKTFRAGHVHVLSGNQNSQVIYGIALELLPFGSALYRILIVIAIIAEFYSEAILENYRSYGNVICLAFLKVTVKGYISCRCSFDDGLAIVVIYLRSCSGIRLKKLELLTYRWEESTQGPPRKYYMITDLGREQLAGLDAAWDELAKGIETIRKVSKA